MTHLVVMTAFACPFFLVFVFIGSSVHAYSSVDIMNSSPLPALQNPQAAARVSGGTEWQISSAARQAQYARSQKNIVARRQHGNYVQEHYQSPNTYKTLPDEVLQNHPTNFPVNHFQSLEYEANNYRPASKYPQSIETYSHNYRRQPEPAIYEEQYQRRPQQTPPHQFTNQESNYFDHNQRPHASPFVLSEQQENQNNYIDYPPYPNQNVNSNQITQNPNPNHFSSYEAHKHHQFYEPPTITPQMPGNIHSPPYNGPFAPQFPPPGASMQRFPFGREPSSPFAHAQHFRNPLLHNKPHNPYSYPSNGHPHQHHHPHHPHHSHPSHHPHHPHHTYSKHPPSYYDPDPELTAELQQLDKEYHAEREGLGGGKSMYRLLVPLLMLGFSIPALGYMYTYMSKRREFRSGRDNQSERVEYYSDLLARAMACYQQGEKCSEHDRLQ